MIQPRLRIVTVGDEQVGKTWLIHMLCDKEIPHEYSPTTYENFCIDKTICGQVVTFSLRDTAGRPSLDEFRSICFNNADIFLLCFSADNRESFVNLRTKWIPYSRSKVENAKLILVETKIDIIYPEIFNIEINKTCDENTNLINNDTNVVPKLNLNSKSIESEIRISNSKNDHKAHPKISIPKSSRNPRKHYLLDVLSSKNRSKSPPKLLNAYLQPNARSLADLTKERSPNSARRRSLQHQIPAEKQNHIDISVQNSENNRNIKEPKIHFSASCETDFQQDRQINYISELYLNKIQPPSLNSKMKTIEIKELPEIDEIDQIICDEEINDLCIEEDISGFVKCSSRTGFQSKSILELATKICALKKRWTPPFRRRVAKV